jgi:hypothetical protein
MVSRPSRIASGSTIKQARRGQAVLSLACERLAADEGHVAAELERPAETRLQRRAVGIGFGVPGAVALLQTQALYGAVAAGLHAEGRCPPA